MLLGQSQLSDFVSFIVYEFRNLEITDIRFACSPHVGGSRVYLSFV